MREFGAILLMRVYQNKPCKSHYRSDYDEKLILQCENNAAIKNLVPKAGKTTHFSIATRKPSSGKIDAIRSSYEHIRIV